MTSKGAPCKARGRGCGTPLGWRRGGRCPHCRSAHNDETREDRWRKARPSDDAVTAFEEQLRAGVDLPAAARAAGIHPSKAHALLRRNPALCMTIAGPAQPLTEQAERQNSYLMQILAHEGAFGLAVVAAGIPQSVAQQWRVASPEFKAADDALRALARARAGKPKPAIGLSAEQVEAFLDGLRDGLTIVAVSRRLGVTVSQFWSRFYKDEAFSTRVREIRPKGTKVAGGHKPPKRKPVDEDRLRAMWAGTLTVAQIAKFFDVTPSTVYARAKELGLGGRRSART